MKKIKRNIFFRTLILFMALILVIYTFYVDKNIYEAIKFFIVFLLVNFIFLEISILKTLNHLDQNKEI